MVINFTESFINGKPKFTLLPQNMKIIPGTQDRVINSPFPSFYSVRSWPMGHHPFLFVFFVFFSIRKHTKYLPWDEMNIILYITTHIIPKPQRILRVHLRWILLHSKSGINGNRKWVKDMC